MSDIKCSECPECGCSEYVAEDYLGEGYRVCASCSQEWWTSIDYTVPLEATGIMQEVFGKGFDNE